MARAGWLLRLTSDRLRRAMRTRVRTALHQVNLRITKLRGWRRFETLPPNVLKVESTNICNANCIFCAYQYEDRPKSFMSDDLYRKCLEEYAGLGGRRLSYVPIVGEPLIDRKFIQKVREAKKHRMQEVYTYTNGLLLNKFDTDELLLSGIDLLIISSAPFDEDMYFRLYRSKGYRRLLQNLSMLLRRNVELGRPVKIQLHLRSAVNEHTALSLPDYVTHIRPYINEATDVGVMLEYDNWGGLIKQEDLFGEMKLYEPARDKSIPCLHTFTLTVLSDGRVRACGCRFNNDVKDDPLIIGDARTQSLAAIWNGDKLRSLRRRFETGELPSLCEKCSAYQPKTLA